MTSFIIVSETPDQGIKEAERVYEKYKIDLLDRTILTPSISKEGGTASLKIKEVHMMLEKASLKPYKSQNKAITLTSSELLTIPAQNALLKLLEEPPEHTIILLITSSLDSLLPTIQSRCQILISKKTNELITDEEKELLLKDFHFLSTNTIGDALKMAEQLAKDKGKTLHWLEDMISLGREELANNIKEIRGESKWAEQLNALSKTHRTLKTTNTNPRLTLESLFLSFLIKS